MATLWVYNISLVSTLVSLIFLVGVEASVKEFERLRAGVFGNGYKRFFSTVIEDKIHNMIKLIEAGGIPDEVQGDQTLKYLRSLTNDCKQIKECNLDEDMQKFMRLRGRIAEGPNLQKYLQICQARIKYRCMTDIYKRVSLSLSPVDEQSMHVIDTFAHQAFEDNRPRPFTFHDSRSKLVSNRNDHATVLRALKKLDPEGSKSMLKKWTNRKTTLEEFMEKIRLPCVKFLDHVDPSVQLLSPNYYYSNNWHFYLNSCKRIVDNWDKILESAYSSYQSHLAGPRP